MEAIYFDGPAAFRDWLAANAATERELLVGYYKKGTGKPSMTWPQSVDEALCVGWIDGVRRSVDDERYTIRFTPRKVGSNWSAINIRRVAELTAEGRMQPAGLAAFAARSEAKSQIYSYEQREQAAFAPEHLERFRANPEAWAFFKAQPPGYRQQMTYRVVTAKQEATRLRRLELLIAASAEGKRLT